MKGADWLICSDVNGPRDSHTKSVRESCNTVFVKAYIWSQEMMVGTRDSGKPGPDTQTQRTNVYGQGKGWDGLGGYGTTHTVYWQYI